MLPLSRKLTATNLTVVAMSSRVVAINDTCRDRELASYNTKHQIVGSRFRQTLQCTHTTVKSRETAKYSYITSSISMMSMHIFYIYLDYYSALCFILI